MENTGEDVLGVGEGPRKVARTDSEGGSSNVWPADPSAYLLLNKVGQGAFAHVWRAELVETKTACAIKILNLEHVDTSFIDIRLEVQTMRLSSHPNVLTCHTSFVHDTNLWLVTQLMRKGSSGHCIHCARTALIQTSLHISRSPSPQSPLPQLDVDDIALHMANNDKLLLEDHITYILHETLLGLKYIHDNGQIHRDIKAGNILLDANGDVRIADFGVSSWLVQGGSRRENTKTFVGTPCWMAPEVMEQVHGYDYKADIWSLGITALELAKGYAPYAKYPPMKVLLLTIQEDPPSMESYDDEVDGSRWSKSFRSMIKLCLQKDPEKRPTCEELLLSKHFKHFANEGVRNARREAIQEELCDLVQDVGEQESLGGAQNLPGTAPVSVVTNTEENRPKGTTWVFSDGSQVLSSSVTDTMDDHQGKGDGDFFDEFERQTGGENFSAQQAKEKQAEKEEMNDFFDEFEKSTGGENFRKPV